MIYSSRLDLYNGIRIEGSTGSVDFIANNTVNFKLKDNGRVFMPKIKEYADAGVTGATGIMMFDIDTGQVVYSTDFSGIAGATGPITQELAIDSAITYALTLG